MERLLQDLRFAVRSLSRDRSFALVSVVTLALGIAATVAAFAVTKSVLLDPLPFPEPDSLVMVWERSPQGLDRNVTSAYNYLRWRDRAQSFDSIGAIAQVPMNVSGLGPADQVDGLAVTAGFFDALGIRPLMGRAIVADDERIRPPRVVVLSYGFWQQRYGGARDVIGKSLDVNGGPREIVGVMPAGFAFPATRLGQLYLPLVVDPAAPPGGRNLITVARVKRGLTLEAARSDMRAVVARMIGERTPNLPAGWTASVYPLLDETVGPVSRILWVIFGSVTCLLILACANVANLLLIRAAKRAPELALRVSLGAARWRLVQLLAVDSVLVTLGAGAIGIGLARIAVAGMPLLFPPTFPLPRATEVRIDPSVAGLTVLVCGLVGLGFSLLPVVRIVQGRLAASLRAGAQSAFPAHTRLRRAIVTAEVALALVLVFAAALMGRSLSALANVNPGFRPDRVLSVSLLMVPARYAGPDCDRSCPVTFLERVLDEIRALPGVNSAGSVHFLPLSGIGSGAPVARSDRPRPPLEQLPSAAVSVVTDGYFETMGIPLVGRDVNRADRLGGPAVAVVNQALVRQLFPGENPIGKYIWAGYSPVTERVEIVGVAGDIRAGTLEQSPGPAVYIAHSQEPSLLASIVVRSQGSPASIADAVRASIARVDPEQGISRVASLDTIISNASARPRVQAGVFGLFGLLALVIAAIGLYGVMAYSVEQRRREMALKLALGAPPKRLLGSVMREGASLAAFGAVAGALLAWVASRSLEGLLYETRTTDPATLGAVAATLIAVSCLATLVRHCVRRGWIRSPVLHED